jgi:hypothetical protein
MSKTLGARSLSSFQRTEDIMVADEKRKTWETYASAWKEASAEGKWAALRQSVEPTCMYRDPLEVAEGHGQLVDYMLRFHEQVPGGHFVTSYFLAHHDRSIAKWTMNDAAGNVVGEGVSYGEYNERGKLVAMTGFFDVPKT